MTEIASRFRRRAGESRQTRQMHDKPLEEGTTASLEALKSFSAGRRASLKENLVVGIPQQKRAVELDPNFALAWAHLALNYADTGQTGPAAEAAKRAYELRNRASDHERFFIEFTYDRIVTGNLERARQTCMSWAQTYPRDPEAHALASGLILQGLGDFDISIEEARKALALDPDLFPAYTNLAYSYFLEGQMKQATNVVAEAEGISEFQKIVDHPRIRFTDPIGSLAYLQISRGYRLLGDRINARGAYETFSKRWLDADPDVPILQEAQREFQALR